MAEGLAASRIDALRVMVSAIERELEQGQPRAELRVLWTELVALLALGPAPDLRACFACGKLGMRAATRCGYCWTAQPPDTGSVTSQ